MTQKQITDISYTVIGCAIEVHKELGPGLLESVYERCLLEELINMNLKAESQVNVPILYKGKLLDSNLVLDILVEDLIVLELKTVESIMPVHKAQLLTYLRVAIKPKGLLINFYTDNIKDSLVSLVTKEFEKYSKI